MKGGYMLEFTNQKPIYLQLKSIIEDSILNGKLKPDEAVPSIRVLARDYQLNPITVSNAITELLDSGILYKKRGIGIFVSLTAKELIREKLYSDFLVNDLSSLVEKAKLLGFSENEVLEIVKKIFGGTDE
jgi:DNA-binding transcriptional regulator YhcF (GntR family)